MNPLLFYIVLNWFDNMVIIFFLKVWWIKIDYQMLSRVQSVISISDVLEVALTNDVFCESLNQD